MTALSPDIEHWRLLLRISDNELVAAAYNPLEEGSLLIQRRDIEIEKGNKLQALESAVYGMPLVLRDFGSIRILYSTDLFLLGQANENCESEWLSQIDPGSNEQLTDVIADGISLDWFIPSKIFNFLQRTFCQATIHNALTPLCSYAISQLSSKRRLFVNVEEESATTIIALDGRNTESVSVYRTANCDDIVYYALALSRLNNWETDFDIIVNCQPQLRNELIKKLREFVANVVPMIYPVDLYKLGKEAISAPFDLLISELCE